MGGRVGGRIRASSAGLRVRLESASLLFYEHSLCMHGPELYTQASRSICKQAAAALKSVLISSWGD